MKRKKNIDVNSLSQTDIALLLRELRRALKITKKSLSDSINISPHTITNIEEEEVSPKISTIQKIMETMGYEFRFYLVPLPSDTEDETATKKKLP